MEDRGLAPPALPVAPDLYERRWHDQLSNQLRLFFTQVTSVLNNLTQARESLKLTAEAEVPTTQAGVVSIYFDSATSELMVKLGDGTVKTITTV